MLNTDKMTTLRRRITDKLCKDGDFLVSVAALAVEEGAIKHTDILDHTEVRDLLETPVQQ
jgi:hypothetical protein